MSPRAPKSPRSLASKRPQSPQRPAKRGVGSEPGERGGPIGLRIIGGRFRGSRLAYAGDHRVRPMKDRVREAVFNLIGPSVREAYVLDLFAGTGALALEAVSRGAAGATLIEQHLPTLRNARQNVAALGLTDCCSCVMSDVFYWSHVIADVPRDRPWLVFCSPPYEFFIQRQADMVAMLERLLAAAPLATTFVIEADARFDFAAIPVAIAPHRRRSYPPAEIAIFTKEP